MEITISDIEIYGPTTSKQPKHHSVDDTVEWGKQSDDLKEKQAFTITIQPDAGPPKVLTRDASDAFLIIRRTHRRTEGGSVGQVQPVAGGLHQVSGRDL
jgi:hypothetical protein